MNTFSLRPVFVRTPMRVAAIVLMLCVAYPHAARADDLTVSAAASLTDAFRDIAKAYETAHPGTHVVLNLAASDVLLKQIEQGAQADVFASADEITMDRAATQIDPASRQDFAGNTLVLVVPANGKPPAALADLKSDAYKRIAIGNPDSVPAGRYAKQALSDAGLWDALQPKLVQAQNVRQALEYVARGEVDAGFVYATDAMAQKQKVAVALRVPTAAPVRYPIAALKISTHSHDAHAFVDFVLAPDSQATLQKKYGFNPPKP